MHKRRIITISVAALMLVSLCAVCVTTSVAAQNSSGAPTNGLDSGTAVCSWGAGRLDVFAAGTDGNLKHKWFDGNWHNWEDLSRPANGGLYSAPTAVSWGPGRIDVFVRGEGGALYHRWFDSAWGWGQWSDWELIPEHPSLTINQLTAPTVCSWGPNRLDVFVLGDDGQIWQLWFDNGWRGWVQLGAPSPGIQGSPGAVSTVSWGYPRVDVFIRGSDGALWQLWWKNGWAWHRFDDTAGLVANSPVDTAPSAPSGYYGTYDYAPAVCSWGANRLDVFFVDMSGHLQQKYFDNGWKPIYNVGENKYVSAAPSAVAWQLAGTTRIDIFARGPSGIIGFPWTDFQLAQKYWAAGSGWRSWYNLGLM